MKKLIYLGMGLLLSLGAALLTGCEKKPLDEPAAEVESPVDVTIGESYVETAFGMALQMVAVQGGTFQMGATSEQGSNAYDDEKPVHSVTLDGFYIGAFEVTQAQWAAVMGTTIEQQRDKMVEDEGEDPSDLVLCGVGDAYPMYYVSWNEAQEFCTKLSVQTGKTYRLPTESEWEYAARGGQDADGTKYAGSNNIGEVAWYGWENDEETPGNSNSTTHPVGTKKANGLGIYDMSGNVWEWCQDWYASYSSSSAVNPQGPASGDDRVYRGGGWYSFAWACRVSGRSGGDPDLRYDGLGFRVVCER